MNPCVVLDLDGVVYRGNEPCPGAREALAELRRMGTHIAFFTNNSTRHRLSVVEHLACLGIEATPDEVSSSGRLAALYIARNLPGRKAFVVGEEGLVRELEELGIGASDDASEAGIVVVGLDRGADYAKLRDAHLAILGGATFIATNRDASFPVENGLTWPGAGSLVAALETSTGVAPLQFGKPSPVGLQMLAEARGCTPAEIVVVGDRLDTDIAAACAFGCISVLVLTGVTTREQAESAPADQRPDHIIRTLPELPGLLRSLP